MIPLAIDTVVRTIFLWGDIEWWRIPDLWTLLVTYAFFCLAVMFSVNVPRIATDPEAHDNIELVKHRLLGSCILAVSFAGGLSCFRAIADLHPTLEMQKKFGLQFLCIIVFFIGYNFYRVCTTYLSYVHR